MYMLICSHLSSTATQPTPSLLVCSHFRTFIPHRFCGNIVALLFRVQ